MTEWQAAATLEMLRLRAALWAQVRAFFAARGVLEVDTPALAHACAPEPMIEPLLSEYHGPGGTRTLYLQSSPELHMKRLLAAGSGPIFQIFRAFRDGESGRFHNPEFSLLEWYRPGFDHHALMDETDALLQTVLGSPTGERLSYAELFTRYTGLHPLHAPLSELRAAAARRGLVGKDLARDACLNFLFSEAVEPNLGRAGPTFVYDYPAGQAALARLNPRQPEYAERFEVYIQGLELANGFHELNDAAEQRARFHAELDKRRALQLPPTPLDERFLAALAAGLPDCAGIALGLDRLLMLKAGAAHIDEVLAFPLARA